LLAAFFMFARTGNLKLLVRDSDWGFGTRARCFESLPIPNAGTPRDSGVGPHRAGKRVVQGAGIDSGACRVYSPATHGGESCV